MKKKVYFHGTRADNLEDILKNGLKVYTDKIWNCSCDEIYLWSVDELAKAEEIENENQQIKEERAFQAAFESSQMAMAASKDCRSVVIRLELDGECEPDESAPNMRGSGAVCYPDNITPDCFTNIKVSDDLSFLKGAFIGLIMDREYCNLEFNKIETAIGNCFKGNDDISIFLIEELPHKINWKEQPIKSLKMACA